MFSRFGLSFTQTALHRGLSQGLRPGLQSVRSVSFIKTIPQPPGNIIGTVNDAYVPPPPNKMAGSRHWTFERSVTLFMTPLVVAPFVTGSAYAPLDAAMSSLLLYHCIAGFESCIADYIPARVYGVWYKAAMLLLFGGSAIAAYGIYVIETTSKEGLFGICKSMWLKKKEEEK